MGTELTKVTFPDTNYIDLNHRVSNVAWDSTNKKLTQTFGKTTTDIVTGETILDPLIPVKTASGSLVSFSDGADLPMPSFICNIDAVQDLHGYDAPWVGGAGKNKLSIADKTATTVDNLTITPNKDVDGNINGIKLNGSLTRNSYGYEFFEETLPAGSYILNADFGTLTQSGAQILLYSNDYATTYAFVRPSIPSTSFTLSSDTKVRAQLYTYKDNNYSNVIIKPMLRLATETDDTFAPYSNICPISGHTGVNAWVSGKNLFNLNPISFPYTYNKIAVSNNNGVIILVGTVTGGEFLFPDGNNLYQTIYKYLKPSTTYVFSTGYSDNNMGLQVFYRETAGASWKKLAETYNRENITFTTPASYAVIWVRVQFVNSAVINNVTLYPMIRLATDTDATYTPYNPNSQTIQVSWQTEAGEVYGGEIDLVSGILTVDRVGVTYSDTDRKRDDGSFRLYPAPSNALVTNTDTEQPSPLFICDKFKFMSIFEVLTTRAINFGIGISKTSSGFYIKDAAMLQMTLEEAQTYLSSHPIDVVYPLATPITYQLTPTQIKSLLGNNNAWCSTGDVDVTYITQQYDGMTSKYSEYAYNVGGVDWDDVANKPDFGTASEKDYTDEVTEDSEDLITSGGVYTAIENLPEPMVFKGSLGTGGTITALPVNGTATVGDTYKVITAGTYAGTAAKVGDTFICDSKTSSANTWTLIPSGDEPSGTVTSVTIKGTSPIVSSNSSAITTSGTRTISHATSGVTAGTYQSVTVDTYGHVTAGSNPTTISGYGITDAKIENAIITLGSNTLTTVPVQNNAGYHNSIYRGKSLGTSITAAQWASIRAGTFEDMYIGDYWTLSTTLGETTSNVRYVIAGFDYWWNCGDSYPQSSNKHHIVLVPATNLYSAKMNDSNITTGGYVGSKMYTDYLANARTGISTLFGDHLYSVRRLFVKTVNAAGQGTAWDWYTSSVDLMNETMVYGHPVWTTSGFEVGVDRTILPLFALNPASASIRSYWWLRCAATSACFAYVDGGGGANCYGASGSLGVRPAFAIY